MKKRILCGIVLAAALLGLCGCGAKKVLHCDHCGLEVEVDADSNMTEEWILFCGECNEKLFADDPVVKPN